MSITQNASRVRIESAAKNGTLGTQGALNANQIKFDTNISTNNSNLEASPSFAGRHVILRRGEIDEELNLIRTVDVDGVTCTCREDWASVPASGDTYDVGYLLEDVATFAGCTFETDSRQWVMDRRLIVGITTTTFGFLGMAEGRVLRLNDEGASNSALQINTLGHFAIGLIKNDRSQFGATLIFTNATDNQLVWDIDGWARLYEFTLVSARQPDGINSLDVTIDAGADVDWATAQIHGIDAPFKRIRKRFKRHDGVDMGTVTDLKAGAWHGGHLLSENDKVIKDEIAAQAGGKRVRLLIEDA